MNRFSGKKVLIVVSSHAPTGEEALGLGDIMRLLALGPNFDAAAIGWCSQGDTFALAAPCGFIGDRFTLDELPDRLSGYDAVLTLGHRPVAPGLDEIVVGDLLRGQGTLKSRTFELPAIVAAAIGIDTDVSWPVAQAARDTPAFDVGFNMTVPEAWRIKELPKQHWDAMEAALGPDVSVSRQPPDGDLEGYLAWVGNCRVLVSIVGLGCHVAMFLGKPLLVLSGPTDFAEASVYPPGRVLYPQTPCEHRPCHLPTGVDNCGCMGDFDPAAIAAAVTDMLTSAGQQPGNKV